MNLGVDPIRRALSRVQASPARYILGYAALGVVLAAVVPAVASSSSLQTVSLACIFGIAAIGLNIIFGLSGLLSIAQAAMMAVGAYAMVLGMSRELGVLPSVAIASLCAGAVSGLTGIAASRARSHYFILLSLALAEIVLLLIVNNPDITGGSNGIPLPGVDSIAGWDLSTPQGLFYVVMPLLLVSWYIADCFKRSRPGLALRALNADEFLALMAGVPTAQARLYATVIGGAFAGLAGALLAIDDAYIGPQSFDIDTAAILLLIVVLGGPGSNAGTVVAATILTLIVQGTLLLPSVGQLLYGVAIILIIIFAPGGLSGLAHLALRRFTRRSAKRALKLTP
jgi:branched-chain amino acid transport system permease protein